MIEYYAQIRLVHVVAVIASGSLFLARGAALFLGVHSAMAAPVRYLSYSIDTVLLTAALMLMTIVHQYPFVHDWLTAKVLLLIAYIILGIFAFRKGGTRMVRITCWITAVAIYAFIFSVARAHHPLGFLSGLTR